MFRFVRAFSVIFSLKIGLRYGIQKQIKSLRYVL